VANTSQGMSLLWPDAFKPSEAAQTRVTVKELRDLTGLSAGQLGRLFGVSRRSINNWLAGAAMAPHHAERLADLQCTILRLPCTTSAERRNELLASAKGTSLFQQLVNQIPGGPMLHGNSLSASDRF
jgi:transcriptional regulator with XRE-family HTH domain